MTGLQRTVCLLWLFTFGVAGAAVLPFESFRVEGTSLILQEGVSGSLPPELGTFGNLTRIQLSGRGLSGTIPPELGNLTELQYLDLSNNNLIRTIPAELGNLSNLVNLNLSFNRLEGPVPPQLGNLGSLLWLNLFANLYLSSSIPPDLGNLSSLQYLNLASNNLSGQIPPSLGKLDNLKDVYLYDNKLTGPIIDGFGKLPNLGTLSLALNNLSGDIPPSLGDYRLATVLLYNNSLSGTIPPALVRRLKNNVTYVCLYIKKGNPGLNLDETSGECPTSPPPVVAPSPSPALAPPPAVVSPVLAPPPAVVSPPRSLGPSSPPPPIPEQFVPSPPSQSQQNLGKLLGLALALPTGLLSFALTVAFFVAEVRRHRRAKRVIVENAIALCRTGARHTSSNGNVEKTDALDCPVGMTPAHPEFEAALTTILNLVLQKLEAWPKCLGLRGDPHEAVWSHNFRRFEHYVLFRALADADSGYRIANSCLVGTWIQASARNRKAIIDGLYTYLGGLLHGAWTGHVTGLP